MKSPEESQPTPPSDETASGEVRVAAVEESLEIGVDTIETGSVRVRKVLHEETQRLPVTLRRQQVQVRRVAVNRPVDERSEPRQEGNTLIIPVFEYVPVVKMQLTLKEEVHVTTTETTEEVIHHVSLNSEELIVERREGAHGEWKREGSDD